MPRMWTRLVSSFDHEEHIQPSQEDGVDVKEVAGQQTVCLRAQKLLPTQTWTRTWWGRRESGCGEDSTHRALPHPVPEPGRFALNAAVDPSADSLPPAAAPDHGSRQRSADARERSGRSNVQRPAGDATPTALPASPADTPAAHAEAAGRARQTAPDPTRPTLDAPPDGATWQPRDAAPESRRPSRHPSAPAGSTTRTPAPSPHRSTEPKQRRSSPHTLARAPRSDVLARHRAQTTDGHWIWIPVAVFSTVWVDGNPGLPSCG